MQLPLRLGQQRRDVELLRQDSPTSRSSVATLSTSASMLSRTPGYCTLIARSRPSRVIARCTCPIDAAAIGVASNRAKRAASPCPIRAPAPAAAARAACDARRSRSRARIWASSGGRISPASIEIIWPSFIAAPRRCDRLVGDRGPRCPGSAACRASAVARHRPAAARPRPCIAAGDAARQPPELTPSRDSRPRGTARARSVGDRRPCRRSPAAASRNALERPGHAGGDPAAVEAARLRHDRFAVHACSDRTARHRRRRGRAARRRPGSARDSSSRRAAARRRRSRHPNRLRRPSIRRTSFRAARRRTPSAISRAGDVIAGRMARLERADARRAYRRSTTPRCSMTICAVVGSAIAGRGKSTRRSPGRGERDRGRGLITLSRHRFASRCNRGRTRRNSAYVRSRPASDHGLRAISPSGRSSGIARHIAAKAAAPDSICPSSPRMEARQQVCAVDRAGDRCRRRDIDERDRPACPAAASARSRGGTGGSCHRARRSARSGIGVIVGAIYGGNAADDRSGSGGYTRRCFQRRDLAIDHLEDDCGQPRQIGGGVHQPLLLQSERLRQD